MSEPVIIVEQGELEGGEAFTDNKRKYFYFKGIPYAEPPVGNLRFKPPIPIKPWEGRKIVRKEGNKSPQIGLSKDTFIGNENCLFLNVYTHCLSQGLKKLYPVMVFIHGGGFRIGSGDSNEFGSDFFIEKDVVLVTMNYRLGALGFLCLENAEVPGNAGLRDQNLALQWIQKNIAKFNGDPNNVTLFGVSAGSVSVEYQMLSPMSRGLFHKAILESGSALNPWTRNRQPKRVVNKLTNFLGITASDDSDLLKQLQDANVDDLIRSAYKTDENDVKAGELFGYAPVVENNYESVNGFLTSDPIQLLKSGNFTKVPTIVGFCSNEGGIFKMNYIGHDDMINNRKYADYMNSFKVMDKETLNKEMTIIYNTPNKTDVQQLHMFLSDNLFISGIYRSLLYRLHYNILNFCYMFSYDGSLKLYESEGDGTMHAAEIPYLTKIESLNENVVTPLDQKIRRIMISMWTNFAKYGNPTPEDISDLTKWLPIKEDNLKIFNINDQSKMQSFPWMERMSVWSKLFD